MKNSVKRMDYHFDHIEDLTEREQQVLLSIIEQHVLTASPIGSRTLSKSSDLNLSPASIRNVMADLEERGLIGHPHTSAGRIPTDLGYRYYVNSMMETTSLTDEERRFIETQMQDSLPTALQEILRTSSHILSQISHQLAIVSAPSLGRGVLQQLELVQVASNKIMVIITIRSGIVKSIILHIHTDVSREQLEGITALLNERLAGLTLQEIRETFADRMRDAQSPEHEGIIRLFIDSTDRVFSERLDTDALCIEGIQSITQQPEFGDPGRMRNIIELVENQSVIVHVLDSLSGGQAVTIRIGHELIDQKLSDYSIIASPYQFGQLSGTVSIVGPKRMDYPRMIAIVDYLAKLIST